MDLERRALEFKEARTPFVAVTVVRTEGSAPRHVGAKMLVTRDESIGTIGGGALEERATKEARELLRLRCSECRRFDLTEEGVQPCGGEVELFFESIAPARPIVVFGAGHIAEHLVPLLGALEYEVTLVDERAERLERPAFSSVQRIRSLPQECLPTLPFHDDLFLVCLTHAHVHDEAIVEFCLDKSFRYFGLISSRAKWKLFCERYRAKGFTDEQLRRIATPIGLDIGAETPAEIAVAIAAELVQLVARPEEYANGTAHFERRPD